MVQQFVSSLKKAGKGVQKIIKERLKVAENEKKKRQDQTAAALQQEDEAAKRRLTAMKGCKVLYTDFVALGRKKVREFAAFDDVESAEGSIWDVPFEISACTGVTDLWATKKLTWTCGCGSSRIRKKCHRTRHNA